MKKYFSVLLLYGILLSPACSVSNRERLLEEPSIPSQTTLENIESQFTSNSIDQDGLIAFETRAMEKMGDLQDYLTILSSPTLDSTFRFEMKKQVLLMFSNAESRLLLNDNSYVTINELIADDSVVSRNKFRFQIISIGQGLKEGMNGYFGELHYQSVHPETQISTRQNMDFNVQKSETQFGSDTKQIWKVYLGK